VVRSVPDGAFPPETGLTPAQHETLGGGAGQSRDLVELDSYGFRNLDEEEQAALNWIREWLGRERARRGSTLGQLGLHDQLQLGLNQYNSTAHNGSGYRDLLVGGLVPLLAAHLTGWRQLYPLAMRPDWTSIFVNGQRSVYVEIGGVDHRVGDGLPEEEIANLVLKLTGQQLNQGHPLVEARTHDGIRLAATHAFLSDIGSALAFRRSLRRFRLHELVGQQMLTPSAEQFLRTAYLAGLSLIVAGGTNSGKTTLAQALLDSLPPSVRVGIVETDAELYPHHDNDFQLHAHEDPLDGNRAYLLSEMVARMLRLQPDRVVVGEIRKGEALPWLNAANSGHGGALATVHADQGVQRTIWRLEGMARQGDPGMPLAVIRQQIALGVQLVVHLKKIPDGRRYVNEIAQVVPSPGSEQQFASSLLFKADPARDFTLARQDTALHASLVEMFQSAKLSPELWVRPGGREGDRP
jgi:pilus assembly protein CpaF